MRYYLFEYEYMYTVTQYVVLARARTRGGACTRAAA